MPRTKLSQVQLFEFGENCLQCPHCTCNCLHHREILISDRHGDADTGKCIHISGIGDWNDDPLQFRHMEKSQMSSNPSPRRGGILIEFDCEGCEAKPQLGIYQHKGMTLVEWFDLGLPEPPKRKAIKPSIRFKVMKRDNYRCQLCGALASEGATLEIDHIVPISKGGNNDEENLQVLCRDCNSGKSDNLL